MTHITLGCRLMAGQRILVPSMGVRLPPSQPLCAVFCRFWPVRLAVQDAALSRRRSPVRIRYGLPRVIPGFRIRGFLCIWVHLPVPSCPPVATLLGSYFEIAYGHQPFDEVERNYFIVNLRAAIGIRRRAKMRCCNRGAKGRAPCERGLGGCLDGESSDCLPKAF